MALNMEKYRAWQSTKLVLYASESIPSGRLQLYVYTSEDRSLVALDNAILYKGPIEKAIKIYNRTSNAPELPSEVFLKLTRCEDCPQMKTERTTGAGLAYDWLCSLADDKKIKGYIEYPSEEPQTIPDWCPLRSQTS